MKAWRKIFPALVITAVLCAGTVSARQLRTQPTNATCGGGCGVNNPCKTGCLCITPMETGSPFCSSHPIPGARVIR